MNDRRNLIRELLDNIREDLSRFKEEKYYDRGEIEENIEICINKINRLESVLKSRCPLFKNGKKK